MDPTNIRSWLTSQEKHTALTPRNEMKTDHQMIDRLLIGGTSIFDVRNRSKYSASTERQVDSYPFRSSIA